MPHHCKRAHSLFRASLGGLPATNVGGKGFFDFSTSTLLQLKDEIFTYFMSETNAVKDEATGLYYVNCDSATNLPNLTVQLEGVTLTFPYLTLTRIRRLGKCPHEGLFNYVVHAKCRWCVLGNSKAAMRGAFALIRRRSVPGHSATVSGRAIALC